MKFRRNRHSRSGQGVAPVALLVILSAPLFLPAPSSGEGAHPSSDEAASPAYLRDRGPGVPTSMFGTYAERGDLLVYPFLEYYKDSNAEYSPQELGYQLDEDFRGDYEATEFLIFLGYGLTDRIAIELEAATITAEQEKAGQDTTAVPAELSESGLGDVQAQVNWMWRKESDRRPALFSYAEVVFPFQKDKVLIGTSDWEFKVGSGLTRGRSWGTTTIRAAVEYEAAENAFGLGEVAVEYLKRLSPTWRVFAGVEGVQDEWELITEAQIHFSSQAFLKLNSAVGLTSKAPGWAPEIGVMFRL